MRGNLLNKGRRGGFTLLEVLLVVAIIAILATVTVLTLNPVEMLRQSRDSKRVSELNAINKALSFVLAQKNNVSLGSSSVIYLSLPDDSSDCSSHTSLAGLPPGWNYRCASVDQYKNLDGSGWIPVDFTGLPSGFLDALPVDFINTADSGLFFTYTTARGGWELSAKVESGKYGIGGGRDIVSTDGGDSYEVFEVGTDLKLTTFICGDINQDRFIAADDLSMLVDVVFNNGWAPPNAVTDLNADGLTNNLDVNALGSYFNGSGPQPTCFP